MVQSVDFEYDLWATNLWLDNIKTWPERARADEILTHMLFAQWIWVRRVVLAGSLNITVPAEPTTPAAESFALINGIWQTADAEINPETNIAYTNLSGQSYENTFAQIRNHVLNHGTYHRGQLRGLAEAQGITTFPETDFIGFVRRTN